MHARGAREQEREGGRQKLGHKFTVLLHKCKVREDGERLGPLDLDQFHADTLIKEVQGG